MKDQIAPLEITSDEKTMATLAHVLQLVGCLVRHNIFVRIFSRRKGSVGSSTSLRFFLGIFAVWVVTFGIMGLNLSLPFTSV
jgi:hypothetical protein